ncbi:HAD hydrolase family protein [Bacillus paralicheniformis]|nr:HAD hydrolase family protein [Bacillus paralicheniformis]
MISFVKYGIAMEDAQKMIKDASRYITQSNNEERLKCNRLHS